jgi:hypothetical protein
MEQEKIGLETSSNLLFDIVVGQVENNKVLREAGKHICIPSPFPRFGEEYPGIQQGIYYIVSGNQKSGKTQVADYMFVYHPIEFILSNDTNIKLKIFDFNLEMSKESKMKQAIVHRLYMKKGLTLSTRELDSIYEDKILPSNILQFVKEDRKWFEKFESIVTYIDDIRNAYGIYKYMKAYFEANGTYVYKTVTISEDGKPKQIQTIDRYIPNDPDLFVIVKIDTINLLTPEKGSNLYDAIGKMSSDYMVRIRNRWGGIPVVIQQQTLDKEGNKSTEMGRNEPSADGLSDNKGTSKDCTVLMTIFSPFRHKQSTYLKYNITKLKDNYRRIAIDFDRNGQACETSVYFNGAVNYFKELPKVESIVDSTYTNIHELMKPKL